MSIPTALRSRAEDSAAALRTRLRGGPPPRPAGPEAPTGWTVALSALRMRLSEVAETADSTEWSIDPDGVEGRALVQGLGSFTFDVHIDRPVLFASDVRLLPHDWLDGRSWVTASVSVTGEPGTQRAVWTSALASADSRGPSEGTRLLCWLPGDTRTLTLSIDRPPSSDGRAVGRAAWIQPRIIDLSHPTAPHDATTIPGDTTLTGPMPQTPDLGGGHRPLISVLVPVHDPPLHMLREAVDSVRAQTFTDWQLCLVDDGSRDPQIIAAVQDYPLIDERIVAVRRKDAGGISDATNAALAEAQGEYVALLDHDDTIQPTALQRIAETVAADPTVDMIYSDEAVMAHGQTVSQSLKPDWSPETMCSLMYTCHLGVYRRSLAVEVGGFDPGFDGCQDYDFVLRMAEHSDRIAHINEQLYRWRAHAASTAGGEQAKPYAYVLQPQAISAHLARRNVRADVQFGPITGMHRVVYEVDRTLEVSIVIAVADEQGLAPAAAGWLAQPHPSWRLVCAAPAHTHTQIHTTLTDAGIRPERITLINAPADTDPATALATAAHAATSPQLLLCQYPAAGLTHDWLTRLIGYSHQPGIGAAGPIILTPDGLIQEAGIAIPHGIPLPLLHGMEAAHGTAVVQNLSAVSGMLATSRTAYEQLDGLRPEYGPLSLIDYCLRARAHHLRTVIVPDARLTTTTPHNTPNDLPALRHLHATHTTPDPYYNARYRDDRGDWTPRVRL
jgi:GT2 family glycosyltransferase